jgi:hypothetical protein
MTELIVYSTEKHLQCEELKDALKEAGARFHEVDIRNPEAIRELRDNGCFALEPPVLQVVQASSLRIFFKNDDLFWDGRLIREAVMDMMQVSRPQTS